jgi:hypothetical protein
MCNSLFSHNINSYKDKEDKIVNMIRKGWSAGTVGIANPALACGESTLREPPIGRKSLTNFQKCKFKRHLILCRNKLIVFTLLKQFL